MPVDGSHGVGLCHELVERLATAATAAIRCARARGDILSGVTGYLRDARGGGGARHSRGATGSSVHDGGWWSLANGQTRVVRSVRRLGPEVITCGCGWDEVEWKAHCSRRRVANCLASLSHLDAVVGRASSGRQPVAPRARNTLVCYTVLSLKCAPLRNCALGTLLDRDPEETRWALAVGGLQLYGTGYSLYVQLCQLYSILGVYTSCNLACTT